MYTVLEQEDVQATPESASSIPVDVTVLIDSTVLIHGNPQVSFQEAKGESFAVEPQTVRLFGSGGSPREFLVTFTLSEESQAEGYLFTNPALKFFQGSRKAGFRVAPGLTLVSATVSLFNLMGVDDPEASDEFSLLFTDPDGKVFSHDPAIAWDPPGGGT